MIISDPVIESSTREDSNEVSEHLQNNNFNIAKKNFGKSISVYTVEILINIVCQKIE